MPNYDDYRRLVKDRSAEEKLATLRPEAIRLLSMLHGYGMLVHKLVQERGAIQMPPDFIDWCKKIVDNTEELMDLVEAFTDVKHRNDLRQEHQESERARAEAHWKAEQEEFPELKSYSSFTDAVKQTANKLSLSFPDDMEITNIFFPSVLSVFSTEERRVNIHAVLPVQKIRPVGYVVVLSKLGPDGLSAVGSKHEGLTKSLDEVVTVICQWLVEKWALEEIQATHEWMKSGMVHWRR